MGSEPFRPASVVTRGRMSPVSTSRSCDGQMLKRAAEPEGPAVRGGRLSTRGPFLLYKVFVPVDLSTPAGLPDPGSCKRPFETGGLGVLPSHLHSCFVPHSVFTRGVPVFIFPRLGGLCALPCTPLLQAHVSLSDFQRFL